MELKEPNIIFDNIFYIMPSLLFFYYIQYTIFLG